MFAYLAIAFGFGTGWIVRSLMVRHDHAGTGRVSPLFARVDDDRRN